MAELKKPVAVKAAEEKKVEVKEAAKKAEPKKAAAKPAAKKAEPKKAEVKEAAKKTEAKPAAKKAEPKKAAPAKKAATAKTAAKETLAVQFSGKDLKSEDIIKGAKEAYKATKNKAAIKTLDVYINVDDSRVYYVVNGEYHGSYEV